MTRKHTLWSILSCCLLTGIGFSVWSGQGFLASTPLSVSRVKGASTDSTIITVGSTTPTTVIPGAYPSLPTTAPAPHILAKQYVLYHLESGKIVTHSPSLESVPIASTTKLMTSHLISKYGNLDDVTTVSKQAAGITGSLANLEAGEQLTVRNLLYALLLVSGNDAAHALAEYTGGKLLNNPAAPVDLKIARFVQEMNTEATRLAMDHTRYQDPAGLDDSGYSNAFDLAKIAGLDITDQNLQPIMNTGSITVYDQSARIRHDLHNSDRLVADYQYQGSLGGKTGFTPAAGHCLVSTATRDGHTLIAVILNTDYETNEASAIEARKLLDYGFTMIRWQ